MLLTRLRYEVVPPLVALIASILPAGAQGQEAGLFSPAEPQAIRSVAATPPDRLTVRRRLVAIDFGMLATSHAAASRGAMPLATLTLNLFENVEFKGIVERTEPTSSGYALLGRIQGVDLGTMALVINGEAVSGTVRMPGATYRIRTAGKGIYAVSQVDLSRIPGGAEPVVLPLPEAKPAPDPQ